MKNNKTDSSTPSGSDRTEAVLSAGSIRAGLSALQQLKAELPYLAGLSPAERQHLRKIGPSTLRMVQIHLQAAQLHRESLPASFDLAQFQSDAEVTALLGEYVLLLDQMRDQARDTLLSVGTRAVDTATEVRTVIQAVSRRVSGVKRTAVDLAAHNRRRALKVAPETAPTASSAAVTAPAAAPPAAVVATASPPAEAPAKAA